MSHNMEATLQVLGFMILHVAQSRKTIFLLALNLPTNGSGYITTLLSLIHRLFLFLNFSVGSHGFYFNAHYTNMAIWLLGW